MLEKLKSWLLNDQLFFAIIVVLVGIASFSLGRASVTTSAQNMTAAVVLPQASVLVDEPALSTLTTPKATTSSQVIDTKALVGSRSGTKYHLASCPGAKQIKEENKIYFKDVQAAEAAGYKPAANCPQLQ